MPSKTQRIQRVLLLVLGVHVVLAFLKFFLGWQLGSLSILSDAVHSFMDGASSVVGFIIIYFASLPPDSKHPYGHRKFEVLATFALAGLLLLSCWEILGTAVNRLLYPVPAPEFSWWAVLFLIGTLGITYSISHYEKNKADEFNSELLAADALHTRSDFFSTLLALIGIGTAKLGWFWLDAVAAIGIVLIIGIAAYSIIYESVDTVSDANRLNIQDVRNIVEEVEGVQNAHAIRSHGMRTDIHLDLHIRIDEKLSAREVFDIENNVTQTLKKKFPEVSYVGIRHEPEPSPKEPKDETPSSKKESKGENGELELF